MAAGQSQMASLVLFALTAGLATVVSASNSVPAFVWSNAEFVKASKPIDYAVLSTESLVTQFFSGMTNEITTGSGPLPAPFMTLVDGRQPKFFLAFVGKELKTGHVAQYGEFEGAVDPLRAIKAVLKSATSSIALPYINGGAADRKPKSMAQSMLAMFRQKWPAGRIALVGECQVAPPGALILESVDEIKAFLEERASNEEAADADLMLVCPVPVAASSPHGALEEEDAAFQAAYSAVEEVGIAHVALYTAEPKTPYWGTGRRVMLGDEEVTTVDATAGTAANVTCDEACLTKATMIEVIAVVIILLITLLSGLCCLGAVDTPTKFEAPRET